MIPTWLDGYEPHFPEKPEGFTRTEYEQFKRHFAELEAQDIIKLAKLRKLSEEEFWDFCLVVHYLQDAGYGAQMQYIRPHIGKLSSAEQAQLERAREEKLDQHALRAAFNNIRVNSHGLFAPPQRANLVCAWLGSIVPKPRVLEDPIPEETVEETIDEEKEAVQAMAHVGFFALSTDERAEARVLLEDRQRPQEVLAELPVYDASLPARAWVAAHPHATVSENGAGIHYNHPELEKEETDRTMWAVPQPRYIGVEARVWLMALLPCFLGMLLCVCTVAVFHVILHIN